MYKEKDDAYGTLVRLNKVDYPDTVNTVPYRFACSSTVIAEFLTAATTRKPTVS